MAKRPLPAASPRRPVNTKISDDVRARLQASADANDRTLSHEIEYRLEQSMRDESRFGSPETAMVLAELGGYVSRAEHLEKRKLLDTTDAARDRRFDGHVRWLLGGIITFHRNMRLPPKPQEIDRQIKEDDETER